MTSLPAHAADLIGAPAEVVDVIQSLWSGYGQILRVRRGNETLILKHVDPPTAAHHPRGWNTSLSHERKLRSYDIETVFYECFSARSRARVAEFVGARIDDGCHLLLLEDLDASGFDRRATDLTQQELDACLRWLAQFHAGFLGVEPEGLWPIGTYWHLDTRPDELAATRDARLRSAAPILDARLNQCRHQTLVHGDAKVANFCFSETGGEVAAVDFQYVGGGCGIKDVAYFLSSCLTERECETQAPRHLDTYFACLRDAVGASVDSDAIEAEWRALYPIAWADFYRFLAGWAPGHWKIHGYSDRLTRQVLDSILR